MKFITNQKLHHILSNQLITKLFLILIAITIVSCKSTSNLTITKLTTNSKASLKKPYVILISLDGFRWDYIEKYQPPHLSKFVNNGVKAKSLIPSFPTKTFPNHYTIATGMYPDHHGIIANSFYSYKNNATYKIRNREVVEDGDFYGGTPIWVQADKNNMVSASYFFVGSEADVQGIRPTYYKIYDGSIKNDARVTQALDWLALHKKERPHMITMYFSDMDDTGHKYGPNNDVEIKKALFELDESLGVLFDKTEAMDLPINIIIVSDHGMAEQSSSKEIPIESVENEQLFKTINNGAIVNIHPNEGIDDKSVFNYLKTKENNFKVYKTENTPGFEIPPKNRDWGTFQILPDYGYYFSSTKRIEYSKKNNITITGIHGIDPKYKDMHGILYANGPAFKNNYDTPSVKNIHIYPLMCELLGLDIPENIDGDLKELKDILKSN